MTPQDMARHMEDCMDIIRRYAPSTTSGNPPLPDPQRLRDVADTLMDIADTIEYGQALARDETPQSVVEPEQLTTFEEGTTSAPFQP